MNFKPHSDKQDRAIFGYSDFKYPLTICATGIQWGKTTAGALWMKMMMFRHHEPDDNFIITSPSFPILQQSTLPPFLRLMDGLGHYDKKNNCFIMKGGGTCWMRTNVNPDSVVGITKVRAILCDEMGLYSLYFWENIQGRSAFSEAPIMGVTSPYSINFLWKEIIKPKQRDINARPDVLLVQARSDENPFFPKSQYEAKKKTMDPRRFNMMFGGQFDKMEGLVYMGFSESTNVIPRITLPMGSKIVGGIDWGRTHPMVIQTRAITPEGKHYQIAEFRKTGLDVFGVVSAVSQAKVTHGIEIFYADPSRPDLIATLNAAGLPTVGAKNDIIPGIETHADLINSRRFQIFEGTSPHSIDEYETYHYPEPQDEKPDRDEKDPLPVDKDNHCMDAARYISIMTHQISNVYKKTSHALPSDPALMTHDQRLIWLKMKTKTNQTEKWS